MAPPFLISAALLSKNSANSLDRRLGMAQSRAGRFVEEKILHCRVSNPGYMNGIKNITFR
jgi:hypothetical protein